MKKASLSETRKNLSELIDQVRHGETIVILDRGRPVARIESVLTADIDPEGRNRAPRARWRHPAWEKEVATQLF